MTELAKSRTTILNGLFWVAIAAAVVYLILLHAGVVTNVIVVLLGFGSVVLVHEFGHFIVAKLGGIKVEAFSIFMPPRWWESARRRPDSSFALCPVFPMATKSPRSRLRRPSIASGYFLSAVT